MKKSAPSALVLLVPLTLSAHAYELSPKPEAGLWRSETRILINGEDPMPTIRQSQQQLLEQLPADQRDALEGVAAQRNPGIRMECITPQQASSMVHIDEMRRKIQRNVPECELTVSSAERSRLRVSGDCRGENGFEGDMQGELEIISSQEIRSSFLGHGHFQVVHEGGGSGQPSNIQQLEISRWTSPDCGAITPNERLSF
ncbi:Protein of unknown function [Halopseudomonas litoralis]|uniref:DUF3617 domain-containing protein n=1 Tax=Halopseudomonas litoralis TaxID=797277 RepID=A0A1H1V2L7_9GAMM|nr:DUF3617 family protein [Halopseudomonas litoralis]SDS79047.1 Protein of unknown function [Halopseudomonas litoralis]